MFDDIYDVADFLNEEGFWPKEATGIRQFTIWWDHGIGVWNVSFPIKSID